jgi:hypothetical protein
MKKILLVGLLVAALTASAQVLMWDDSHDTNTVSFDIYRGATSSGGNYIATVTNTWYSLTNEPAGVWWYYVIAVGPGGESDPSVTISWTNAPRAVRISN